MRVLVTGHRGYIGTVMTQMLIDRDESFIMGVDISSNTSKREESIDISRIELISHPVVAEDCVNYNIDTIFHFAASAAIEDSVKRPALYYWNNLGETTKLLDNLIQRGWKGKFIFSSTAAVYGECDVAVSEDSPKQPCNSYGTSKLMCEQAIQDICVKAGIDCIIFRYFNVAGAYRDAGDHLDSDHILPKICSALYDDKPFVINGNDYDTRDCTCVRDYVHVVDICRAHFRAVEYLESNPGIIQFNLGSGEGFTNREMVEAFQKYTGEKLEWGYSARRPGDPPLLIADNKKFIEQTGFEYTNTNLEDIVKSSWQWYKNCRGNNDPS